MREHDGRRFYTSEDVSYGRVREAMRDAGSRTTPYPLAWLGVTGHKFLIRGRPAPAPAARPSRYGPHRPDDTPTRDPVRYFAGGQEIVTAPDELIDRQRAQINRRAEGGAINLDAIVSGACWLTVVLFGLVLLAGWLDWWPA